MRQTDTDGKTLKLSETGRNIVVGKTLASVQLSPHLNMPVNDLVSCNVVSALL